MSDKRKKVLFVCMGNACRSQMAEAILRHVGGDRFEAFSAGAMPAGFVHALAEAAMERMGIPMEDPVSKGLATFQQTALDVVITLCDEAAACPRPVWTGDPITAHWGLPDPSYFPGTDEERLAFALKVAERLKMKVDGLCGLDFSQPREAITERLAFLGEI